jgi:hypothetical protein
MRLRKEDPDVEGEQEEEVGCGRRTEKGANENRDLRCMFRVQNPLQTRACLSGAVERAGIGGIRRSLRTYAAFQEMIISQASASFAIMRQGASKLGLEKNKNFLTFKRNFPPDRRYNQIQTRK